MGKTLDESGWFLKSQSWNKQTEKNGVMPMHDLEASQNIAFGAHEIEVK